ncbi:MAG TPA: 50S ribosomal protein L29 [Candidatus Saccharimonadales bacterium]|nr:50S ribosomal protein L29 [Candidatus Saccharimonadales bacterium]
MAKQTTDYSKLSTKQLQDKLAELRADQLQAKQSLAAGELVNPRVVTSIRKDIARVMTYLNKPTVKEEKD